MSNILEFMHTDFANYVQIILFSADYLKKVKLYYYWFLAEHRK